MTVLKGGGIPILLAAVTDDHFHRHGQPNDANACPTKPDRAPRVSVAALAVLARIAYKNRPVCQRMARDDLFIEAIKVALKPLVRWLDQSGRVEDLSGAGIALPDAASRINVAATESSSPSVGPGRKRPRKQELEHGWATEPERALALLTNIAASCWDAHPPVLRCLQALLKSLGDAFSRRNKPPSLLPGRLTPVFCSLIACLGANDKSRRALNTTNTIWLLEEVLIRAAEDDTGDSLNSIETGVAAGVGAAMGIGWLVGNQPDHQAVATLAKSASVLEDVLDALESAQAAEQEALSPPKTKAEEAAEVESRPGTPAGLMAAPASPTTRGLLRPSLFRAASTAEGTGARVKVKGAYPVGSWTTPCPWRIAGALARLASVPTLRPPLIVAGIFPTMRRVLDCDTPGEILREQGRYDELLEPSAGADQGQDDHALTNPLDHTVEEGEDGVEETKGDDDAPLLGGEARGEARSLSGPPTKGEMRYGLKVVTTRPLRHGCTLVVSQGAVVDFEGGAIVNSASEDLQGGDSVDAHIAEAAGHAFAVRRAELPPCTSGEAVLMAGVGKLKAQQVIHAVGPDYRKAVGIAVAAADETLKLAYAAAMATARGEALPTVAFAPLSGGVYRGAHSLEHVLKIGLTAVGEGAYEGLSEVHFVAADAHELAALLAEVELVLGPEGLDGLEAKLAEQRAAMDVALGEPVDSSTSAWLEDGVLACIDAMTIEPAILEELRSDRLLVALVGAASRHPESPKTMEFAAAVIERLDAAAPTSARHAAVMAQAEARAQASVHIFSRSLFGSRMRARESRRLTVEWGRRKAAAHKLSLKHGELERTHSSIFRFSLPPELESGRLRYSLALFRLDFEYCFVSHSSNAFPGLDNFDVDVYELKFLFYRLAQRYKWPELSVRLGDFMKKHEAVVRHHEEVAERMSVSATRRDATPKKGRGGGGGGTTPSKAATIVTPKRSRHRGSSPSPGTSAEEAEPLPLEFYDAASAKANGIRKDDVLHAIKSVRQAAGSYRVTIKPVAKHQRDNRVALEEVFAFVASVVPSKQRNAAIRPMKAMSESPPKTLEADVTESLAARARTDLRDEVRADLNRRRGIRLNEYPQGEGWRKSRGGCEQAQRAIASAEEWASDHSRVFHARTKQGRAVLRELRTTVKATAEAEARTVAARGLPFKRPGQPAFEDTEHTDLSSFSARWRARREERRQRKYKLFDERARRVFTSFEVAQDTNSTLSKNGAVKATENFFEGLGEKRATPDAAKADDDEHPWDQQGPKAGVDLLEVPFLVERMAKIVPGAGSKPEKLLEKQGWDFGPGDDELLTFDKFMHWYLEAQAEAADVPGMTTRWRQARRRWWASATGKAAAKAAWDRAEAEARRKERQVVRLRYSRAAGPKDLEVNYHGESKKMGGEELGVEELK